jgi:hypothetical protein
MPSQLVLARQTQIIGQIEFDCNLGNHKQADDKSEASSMTKITTGNFPDGLLIVTCYVGVHSEQIYIMRQVAAISENQNT